MRLVLNPMDRKSAQYESNGNIVEADLCAQFRTAAVSIRKLSKAGRENRAARQHVANRIFQAEGPSAKQPLLMPNHRLRKESKTDLPPCKRVFLDRRRGELCPTICTKDEHGSLRQK